MPIRACGCEGQIGESQRGEEKRGDNRSVKCGTTEEELNNCTRTHAGTAL